MCSGLNYDFYYSCNLKFPSSPATVERPVLNSSPAYEMRNGPLSRRAPLIALCRRSRSRGSTPPRPGQPPSLPRLPVIWPKYEQPRTTAPPGTLSARRPNARKRAQLAASGSAVRGVAHACCRLERPARVHAVKAAQLEVVCRHPSESPGPPAPRGLGRRNPPESPGGRPPNHGRSRSLRRSITAALSESA